jgi:hypothetical protein
LVHPQACKRAGSRGYMASTLIGKAGLFPTLLERRGLASALSAHLAKQGSVALTVETSADRRFDFAVESATYLFCVEAANAVGGSADVTLAVQSRSTGQVPQLT